MLFFYHPTCPSCPLSSIDKEWCLVLLGKHQLQGMSAEHHWIISDSYWILLDLYYLYAKLLLFGDLTPDATCLTFQEGSEQAGEEHG